MPLARQVSKDHASITELYSTICNKKWLQCRPSPVLNWLDHEKGKTIPSDIQAKIICFHWSVLKVSLSKNIQKHFSFKNVLLSKIKTNLFSALSLPQFVPMATLNLPRWEAVEGNSGNSILCMRCEWIRRILRPGGNFSFLGQADNYDERFKHLCFIQKYCQFYATKFASCQIVVHAASSEMRGRLSNEIRRLLFDSPILKRDCTLKMNEDLITWLAALLVVVVVAAK